MSDIVEQLRIAVAVPICKPAADEIESLRQQLAASQAREQQLLEAIDDYFNQYPSMMKGYILDAINQPTDTTALETMIAKAGEVMRERCSDSAQAEMDEQYIDSSPWYAARACREAIMDIPCVTLEDLQK